MAKISPASIKYMIHASFTAAGPLEKPDVIGAIFGQTEGLLGEELEMRELQKEGKIGRIEVELSLIDGKSLGEIQIPSALDKSETTLVAAALETIDKVGPTEAKIQVRKIEDVRGAKRDFIIGRAKELLGHLESNNEIEDINKTVQEGARAAKIQEYGAEKLPAGDLSGNEIVVVEGRADVVNLLKNRVNNVIGMNGTKLPAEIAKLGNEKELTLFVDGDRGGKLIAKNVIANAKIVAVAVAPDGKEVEELTGKEILMALRKKVPTRVYLNKLNGDDVEEEEVVEAESNMSNEEAIKMLREKFKMVQGTREALLIDLNGDVIKKVSSREISRAVGAVRNKVFALVVDGQATAGIIGICDERGIDYLGATTFSAVENSKVKLVSL